MKLLFPVMFVIIALWALSQDAWKRLDVTLHSAQVAAAGR